MEHLDWRLGTKGLHSDPVGKTFLGVHIAKVVKPFVKNEGKNSVAGSCTIKSLTPLVVYLSNSVS